MPSNYTIAKTLQRVACYREICGHDPGQYPGTAMEVQFLRGGEISALREDGVPLTILEITEIKGLGPKLARRVYDALGVIDLPSLKEALEKGTLAKTKGFGPKLLDKISSHKARE